MADDEATPAAPASVDRRTAVRRAATAVGLTAGALALPALSGTAQAKPGDSVRAGGATAAGTAQTGLRASSNIAALKVENTHVRAAVKGQVDVVSPQLRLSAPVPSVARPQVPDLSALHHGDLAAAGGMLFFGADLGAAAPAPVQVHSAAFGNFFHAVTPAVAIVVDSSTLTAEQRLTFPAGTFDAQGRLAPKRRVAFSLKKWVNTLHLPTGAAVSLSVSTSSSVASGVVSAHLGEKTPGSIPVTRFTVLPGEVVATGQPYALPATSGGVVPLDGNDVLWLSTSAATHVVVQLVGLLIPDPSAVVEPATVPEKATGRARRTALQRQAVREMTADVKPGK